MSPGAKREYPATRSRPERQADAGVAPVVGAVVTVVLVLFGLLALLHQGWGVDVRVLLRDPAETADIPEYAGAYMYAGVLLLWTAGIVALVAGLTVRERDAGAGRFAIGLGAFLCWLAADDLFMIHEWLGLGLSRLIGVQNEYLGRTRLEGVVFLAYGLIALLWMWRYRAVLARREPALFVIAVGCFALSVGVDVGGSVLDGVFKAGQALESTRSYAEEMLKTAGILFMVVYVARSARSDIRRGFAAVTVGGER